MVFERALETGSLQRAANDMALTQPAITKVIQELESYFGGALFDRSSRGVQPTELGVVLGRRVKSIMAEFERMTEDVNAFQDGRSGHVLVGTLVGASAKLLPLSLVALKTRVPDVLVTIQESDAAQLFSALAGGKIDIAVGRLPEQTLAEASVFPLRHEILFEENLCLVGGAKFWAERSKEWTEFDPAALNDVAWILPVPDSPSRYAVENYLRQNNLPMPRDVVESPSMLANIGLMMETPRVALMSRSAIQQFVDVGLLHILDSSAAGSIGPVGFTVQDGKELKPACKILIECLREVATLSSTHPSQQ